MRATGQLDIMTLVFSCLQLSFVDFSI